MVVDAEVQTKRTMCIALLNVERSVRFDKCAANHEVEYYNGWFRVDGGKAFQRPDITSEAEQLLRDGHKVGFWEEGNTYVFWLDRSYDRLIQKEN